MADKVVLAYSGGLDTSVAIKWIKENYGYDVIALTIDLGSERDLPSIRQRALDVGAIDAKVVDGRYDFLKYFAFPALQAGAIYEREYPLATAIGRPLIAKYSAKTRRPPRRIRQRSRSSPSNTTSPMAKRPKTSISVTSRRLSGSIAAVSRRSS